LTLQDQIIKTSGIEFTGFCRKIRVVFYRFCQSRDKYAHVDIQSLRKDLEKVSIIKMPVRGREEKNRWRERENDSQAK